MIEALAILLALQLAGEVLVLVSGLPLPGPVVGMALLFLILLWRGRDVPAGLATSAQGVLNHLSLMFVPAGVGVVVYVGIIADQWLAIATSLVVSTLLTMLVTGWVMQALNRGNSGQADND